MACLDRHQVEIPLALLRVVGEACVQVGDTPAARGAYQRALARLDAQTPDTEDHAALLIAHSRLLIQDGEPDRALDFLEQAKQLLSTNPHFQREHSIVLGVHRRRVSRLTRARWTRRCGFAIRKSCRSTERLGRPARAGGDAGRTLRRSSVDKARGQLDEALRIRHQEELPVYRAAWATSARGR
jgi:tetratricopeptide (TPR) repeat protein